MLGCKDTGMTTSVNPPRSSEPTVYVVAAARGGTTPLSEARLPPEAMFEAMFEAMVDVVNCCMETFVPGAMPA